MQLKQNEVEMLLQNFFTEHDLIFEGSYPTIEKKQKITRINVLGNKGAFFMKLDADLNLYTQNAKRTNWIKIEKY